MLKRHRTLRISIGGMLSGLLIVFFFSSSPLIAPSGPEKPGSGSQTPQQQPPPSTGQTNTPKQQAAPWARVGIQIGHWRASELPAEQAHLRGNGGAVHNGRSELEINLALGQRVAALLEQRQITVDLLPATVPERYSADAFVAIHADYAGDPAIRGYKVGVPWRASPAALRLQAALERAFARSDQPRHDGVNATMRGYFAFNHLRYTHAIAPTTPGVIVEAGFITNPDDAILLSAGLHELAATIAAGIEDYLGQPSAPAEREPPWYPLLIPAAEIAILAEPQIGAAPVATLGPGDLLWTYDLRGGWYRVVLPPDWDQLGWIAADQVEAVPDATFRAWQR